MPQAPMLPPEMMPKTGAGTGVNPANFLMAAADMSKQGQLPDAAQGRSMPSALGHALQTGKGVGRKAKLKVLK
jgi:hypothetical protein